jgi:ABC-2 type transport system permease protein
MMRRLWAMFLRDLQTDTSYRLAFVLQFASIFFSVFIFYFLSELIGEAAVGQIDTQDGRYFPYVLVGIAFSGYFGVGLNSFASALRTAQTTGTLEALMMTPTRLSTIIVGSASYSYLFTTLRVGIYLLLGLALGVRFEGANWLAAGLGLLLAIIAFASIGIVAAAFIMVLKRGDPITWLVANLAALLGGVYYPVTILPHWLRPVAQLLPITYALDVMRGALLNNAGWSQLVPNLLVLGGFCVVLFPLSLLIFRFAVHKARVDGSLAKF